MRGPPFGPCRSPPVFPFFARAPDHGVDLSLAGAEVGYWRIFVDLGDLVGRDRLRADDERQEGSFIVRQGCRRLWQFALARMFSFATLGPALVKIEMHSHSFAFNRNFITVAACWIEPSK